MNEPSRLEEQNTIFVSYRRSNSRYLARALFMDLHKHDYDVFLDTEKIDAGDFERIILAQIGARAHFILLLNTGTLDRCLEEGDWVRREIEYAMELERNIIPVLVDDFNFDDAEPFMTGKLAELPKYNALKLYYDYFDEGLDRLRSRFLKQPIYVQLHAIAPSDAETAAHQIEAASAEPVPTAEELDAEEIFARAYAHYHMKRYD